MSDEHEVTAGMDRSIGELLEHADRDRLPDTMLYFESHDGRNHVAVSAALILAERALPQRRACVA